MEMCWMPVCVLLLFFVVFFSFSSAWTFCLFIFICLYCSLALYLLYRFRMGLYWWAAIQCLERNWFDCGFVRCKFFLFYSTFVRWSCARQCSVYLNVFFTYITHFISAVAAAAGRYHSIYLFQYFSGMLCARISLQNVPNDTYTMHITIVM